MQGHLISKWFNSTAVYQEHKSALTVRSNFHNDFSHFMAHALQDFTWHAANEPMPETSRGHAECRYSK